MPSILFLYINPNLFANAIFPFRELKKKGPGFEVA